MIDVRKKMVFFLTFLVSFSSMAAVVAQEDDKAQAEMARTRTYPGGVDEEDLKVRETIVDPNVSIYKSTVDKEIIEELQKEKADSANENE